MNLPVSLVLDDQPSVLSYQEDSFKLYGQGDCVELAFQNIQYIQPIAVQNRIVSTLCCTLRHMGLNEQG